MENFFLKLSIMLVPALMAITCHEVSHGFVAHRLGDNTARSLGRLTLNPLKHLDIFGTLMIFIIGIGWAKPVPVNYNNLRNPKQSMIWVSAAGPITNFGLAVLSALAMRAIFMAGSLIPGLAAAQPFLEPTLLMLGFSVYINLLLAVFNLIPVPPLDGGRVMTGILPHRQAEAYARIEPFGMIIIILLVFFTDIFSHVILPIIDTGTHLLAGPHSNIVYSARSFLMR